MTVSAAIPVTGVALDRAAISDGLLACGELCVLAHPAKPSTIVNSTENSNLARFLIILITLSESFLPESERVALHRTPRQVAARLTIASCATESEPFAHLPHLFARALPGPLPLESYERQFVVAPSSGLSSIRSSIYNGRPAQGCRCRPPGPPNRRECGSTAAR